MNRVPKQSRHKNDFAEIMGFFLLVQNNVPV